jgi:CubicO group peptidase (beta-lactamase class C family)
MAPWPGETWPTATPESQGLDSDVLASAVRLIRSENINIHSILLIRNGFSVLDVSFYPYDGKRLHDIASVTKSVTASLVGQAVSEKSLPDLNTPVLRVLDQETPDPLQGEWGELTLENLVTMSSGLECGAPPLEEKIFIMRSSADWVKAALNLPVTVKPGAKFDYCSPNFHLLSAALQRATGTSLASYAREHLFAPIGIREYKWPGSAICTCAMAGSGTGRSCLKVGSRQPRHQSLPSTAAMLTTGTVGG